MYRAYLKILAACYFGAFLLRLLDIFDARLQFSRMGTLGQAWTIYLLFSDGIAAMALWRPWRFGDLLFILVVLTQLGVFVAWAPYLSDQNFTVAFHLITLSTFLVLLTYRSRPVDPDQRRMN